MPKTVKEALAIDEETGNDFWRKALGKEMTKVKVAWKSARRNNVRAGTNRKGTFDDWFPEYDAM